MNLISEDTDNYNKINSIVKRDLERRQNIQKKNENKSLIIANNEKIDFFHEDFLSKQLYISDLIRNSNNVPKMELPNHFNLISNQILTLQKYIAASNLFLRNYDIQRYQQLLQELSSEAKSLEEKLLPKKKFGFKNKKTKMQQKVDEVDSSKIEDIPNSPADQLNGIWKENYCGFENRKGETLVMSQKEILKKDVNVENLKDCKVVLKGSPSTLHLNNLRKCIIFSGPVSTSIFAENCFDCILVIACQQLRLHGSKNVKIYLQVTSRAIMEDCKEISFAPYNWSYEGINEDFALAGLDCGINNWKSIDDFNWLNVEKHSPNWEEIKEENRVEQWDEVDLII